MNYQRLFLVFALALILMLIWQAWEQEKQSQRPAATAPAPVPAVSDRPPVEPPPRGVPEAPPPLDRAVTPKALKPAKLEIGARIQVRTDLLEAVIDTHGGDLRVLRLRKHPVSVDKPDEPFTLLDDSDDGFFVAQSGLIGYEGKYPNHKARYVAEGRHYTLAGGQTELRVPLKWRGPDGARYIKTYIFRRDSYVIDVEYTVINAREHEWNGFFYGQLKRSYADKRGMFALPIYTGAAIYTPEDKYQKIAFEDMADTPLAREVTGGWVAILQHYFVGAWMPGAKDRNQFYSDVLDGPRYVIGYKNLTPARIAPGQTGKLGASLYVGPKEQRRLKQLIEGMALTVDYGWLTVLSAPLFWLLEWIHGGIGNWGWAIIFLTILIKLVFYPLSAASYKSMARMKKVQPKLKSIKERYGNDKQRVQQAMMELYKTEKINPLGGCLPVLIQIPVFIALYWVLLESVEMRQAPFMLWIRDLSLPDPYYVLPLVMGLTMFLQQKMNPAPLDPIQKKIFTILPVMFTVFFLFFPAGLVLYWVVNNILSIAQQWQILRTIKAKS